MQKRLTGKVAIVTGASKGLGASIAIKLAEEGAQVAVNYLHNHESAKRVVNTIRTFGGAALEFRCDVTDEDQVQVLYSDVTRLLGSADILVNNATGLQPLIKIEEQTWQDHLNQLLFFVKAPVLLLQAVLPSMKSRRYGRIINIGSEVAELGNAEFSHYAAAKAAMLGLTRSWATELGPFGITSNLIAPGWIPVERHEGTSAASLAEYTANIPLGRQGIPDDVAEAVAFLSSDQAGFITGQRLAVNGGRTF